MNRIICFFCAALLLLGCVVPALASQQAPQLGAVGPVTTSMLDETTVSLQWDAVPGATGYKVCGYNEDADRFKTLVTTTATTAVVFSLARAQTHRFRVRAFQKTEEGNVWGDYSPDAYAVTPPGKLRRLQVKDVTFDTVTLGWKQAKGATHYEIYLFDEEKQDFRLYGLSGHLQMTVRKLEKNRTYRFRVRPFRLDKGKYAPGELSGEISETTDTTGLPHTAWQAVNAYNRALNAAKSNDSFQLTHKKTIKVTDHSVSREAFRGTVKNLMQLFTGSRTRRYTVKNGKTADGTTALQLLPPAGKQLALTPDDLKSYAAEKTEDGGYTLSLTLNEDVSLFENGETSRPPLLSKATGWLRFEKLDTTPIHLQSGKVFYDGAVLRLTVDKAGRLLSLKTRVRAALKLNCTAASVPFDAAIAYHCTEQYTLAR